MEELNESRETIRAIDIQMASLFVKRMEAVRDIAQYKFERDLPIEDKEQEARIQEERSAQIEDVRLRPFYVEFLQNAMDVSKSWQRCLIHSWQDDRESVEED